MIKINLLPVKKKKKAKQLPGFVVSLVLLLLVSAVISAYLVYFFNGRVSARKQTIAKNDAKIEELSKKIKAVENYEKLNAAYQKNKEIIEQLGKNKTLPVKVLDEVSALLPVGVWLTLLDVKGTDINLSGMGFTNSDVVNYVDNLKKSPLFTDVYLKESRQQSSQGYSAYMFSLSCKVKI
jgi:type IV pilus assembly protein PilN